MVVKKQIFNFWSQEKPIWPLWEDLQANTRRQQFYCGYAYAARERLPMEYALCRTVQVGVPVRKFHFFQLSFFKWPQIIND